MKIQCLRAIGGLVALLLAGARLDAGGIPVCRVRVTTSGAAQSVSRHIVREVESWVDVRDRGSILVASVAEADVLLELRDYTFKVAPEGMPVQEWSFTARRLGEPNPAKATRRFALVAAGPLAAAARRISGHLPTHLADICLGVLPSMPAEEPSIEYR